MSVFAVILAGGVGARFWPRSRQRCPKQYLSVFSDQSLIQSTIERIGDLVPTEGLLAITRSDQAALLHEQLPQLGPEQILLEPAGRSTAPCIGLAAHLLGARDPDALMLVLPSDHLIQDGPLFQETLQEAISYVQEHDVLMTIGIQPTHPETGYGYILFEPQPLQHGIHHVRHFVEKPDIETARRYVQSERYLWNAGMFIWKAATILAEIEKYDPELYALLQALPKDPHHPDFAPLLAELYPALPTRSIDYTVMEKSDRVCVIKGFFGWSDVGSWESVYQRSPHDHDGNVIRGDVFAHDCSSSYIYTPHRFAAVIGVRDLLVIDTEDALLVCHRERAQDVRQVIKYLERAGRSELA
ncbi:MAG: mannose-1-phosphate guanylyltransferase [Candidatus Sericytochromatia bacterium]